MTSSDRTQTVEEQILEYLGSLLGRKLSFVRNIAFIPSFQFGPIRQGEDGTVGDVALHIQCPWRIYGPTGVVTGRADLREPAEESEDCDWATWDYKTGDNLQGKRIGALLGGHDDQPGCFINMTDHLLVETIQADAHGGAILGLSGGYTLTLFPDGSREEAWRLFRPYTKAPHFIVYNGGTVEEDEDEDAADT